MYPGAICSAVHAATRCAFAITTLHPGSNLKNLVYEEGEKRGSLQLLALFDGGDQATVRAGDEAIPVPPAQGNLAKTV